uniref:Uncharacterized protein n=1 Tax=Anguilla anguilla TaxID=7936 RepID=A0A0E9RWX4_ANGAN
MISLYDMKQKLAVIYLPTPHLSGPPTVLEGRK